MILWVLFVTVLLLLWMENGWIMNYEQQPFHFSLLILLFFYIFSKKILWFTIWFDSTPCTICNTISTFRTTVRIDAKLWMDRELSHKKRWVDCQVLANTYGWDKALIMRNEWTFCLGHLNRRTISSLTWSKIFVLEDNARQNRYSCSPKYLLQFGAHQIHPKLAVFKCSSNI